MNKPSSSFESLPGSGASSPGLEMPLIRVTPSASSSDVDRFSSVIDAAWLRDMLDQANREKAVFLTTIQNLYEDKAELQAKIDNMQAEKDQITQERDLLRSVVSQLQHQPARATANPNPYGVIGGGRNLGARASWTGPATSTSRASSHSDPEEGDYDGPIRGSGPRF
jgi:hypothetical protein